MYAALICPFEPHTSLCAVQDGFVAAPLNANFTRSGTSKNRTSRDHYNI
jgi:hypothetical protein